GREQWSGRAIRAAQPRGAQLAAARSPGRRWDDFAQARRPGQGVLDRVAAPRDRDRGVAVSGNERVLVAVQGGVLTATLNRPDKKNAIDTSMIDALLAALERADLDAAVRVVALRGAGGDFCAGMDLQELLASAD